jgi:hypothetical protein
LTLTGPRFIDRGKRLRSQLATAGFCLPSAAFLACTLAMMVLGWPELGILLFGVTHWGAFFLPGVMFLLRGRRSGQNHSLPRSEAGT